MAERKSKPWTKANPKKPAARTTLSPKKKQAAKTRARKAGRPYPNLVDNMAVSKQKKSK